MLLASPAVRAEEAYDVVVYGSTPAGITAAALAVDAGNWRAAAKGRVAKLTLQVVEPDVSPARGFRLLVHPGGVLVKSPDDAGFAFAYRTLRKRARVGSDGSWKLPCCHLVDYP